MVFTFQEYIHEGLAAEFSELSPHTKALIIPSNVERDLQTPERFHLYRAQYNRGLHFGVIAATADLTTVLLLHGMKLTAGALRNYPGAERQLKAAGVPVPSCPKNTDSVSIVLVESIRVGEGSFRADNATCSYRTTATLSATLIRSAVTNDVLKRCVSCLHFTNAFLACTHDTPTRPLTQSQPMHDLLVAEIIPEPSLACEAAQQLRVLGRQQLWPVSPFRLADFENCLFGFDFSKCEVVSPNLTAALQTFSATLGCLSLYRVCTVSKLDEQQRMQHSAAAVAVSAVSLGLQLLSAKAAADFLNGSTIREHVNEVGSLTLECEKSVPIVLEVVQRAKNLCDDVDSGSDPSTPKEFYQLWKNMDAVLNELKKAQELTTCLLARLDALSLRVSGTLTTVKAERNKCVAALPSCTVQCIFSLVQAAQSSSGMACAGHLACAVGFGVAATWQLANSVSAQLQADKLVECLMSLEAYTCLFTDLERDVSAAEHLVKLLREKSRKRPARCPQSANKR